MTHISLIYFVFSNCLVEKVCCGSLIFGIRHADDGIEQLGPRLFSIWGNIFPFSVMGGSLGRWRCCVLREVPFASSSDTFFVCGQSRFGIWSYHLRSSTQAAHGEFSLPHYVGWGPCQDFCLIRMYKGVYRKAYSRKQTFSHIHWINRISVCFYCTFAESVDNKPSIIEREVKNWSKNF